MGRDKYWIKIAVLLLAAAFMAAAFWFGEWRSYVDDPLPPFVNPDAKINDAVLLGAYAQAASRAVDFLVTLQFGLFVVTGVAIKDGFSRVVATDLPRMICTAGFFFFSFLSAYYAYLGYQGALIQLANSFVAAERLDSALSHQALFLALSALFTFVLAGLSLLDVATDANA